MSSPPRAVSRLESDVSSLEKSLSRMASKNSLSTLAAIAELSPGAVAVAFILCLGDSASKILTPPVFARLASWTLGAQPDFREGVLFAAALVLTAGLGRISIAFFNSFAARVGSRVRDAVRSLLLTRVLRAPLSSVPATTSELHNLATAGTDALEALFVGGVSVIILPMEAVVLIVLLWFDVSWAALAAVGIAAVIFVASFVLSRHIRELIGLRSQATDERLGTLLKALGSIATLKRAALEPVVEDSVLVSRKSESQNLRQIGVFLAVNYLFSNMAPLFISVAVYAVFTEGLGRPVGHMGFSAIATLSVLYGIQSMLPLRFKQFDEALAVLTRLDKFLQYSQPACDRLSGPGTPHLGNGDDGIHVVDASFAWSSPMLAQSVPPSSTDNPIPSNVSGVLQRVNLHIPAGALACVVGGAGVGKSALLLGLLGELHLLEGSVSLGCGDDRPRVAWVPQHPWIWAEASIRDNIVLNEPWDPERYAECLRATALDATLQDVDDEDAAITRSHALSHSVMMRIALARAAYSSAPIVLIDDCLPTLGVEVAGHILERCILQFMSGRTRVLVTNESVAMSIASVVVELGGSTSTSGTGSAVLRYLNPAAPSMSGAEVPSHSQPMTDPSLDAGSRTFDSQLHASLPQNPPIPDTREFRSGSTSHKRVPTLTKSAVDSISTTEGPASFLPFAYAWELAVGGRLVAAVFFVLVIVSMAVAYVGVFWKLLWLGDSAFDMATLHTYVGVFAAIIGFTLITAMIRIIVVAQGIVTANDTLHNALLFRLLRAPQSFFDKPQQLTKVADIMGGQLNDLDANSLFPTNYFWVMASQFLQFVIAQLVISPWLLMPVALVVPGILYPMVSSASPADTFPVRLGSRRRSRREHQYIPFDTSRSTLAEAEGPRFRGVRAAQESDRWFRSKDSPISDGDWKLGHRNALSHRTLFQAQTPSRLAKINTREALDSFFDMSVDAAVSLRAFGVTDYIAQLHADRVIRYRYAHKQEFRETWRNSAVGSAWGAMYYALSAAVMIALRSVAPGPGLPPGVKGFVFFSGSSVYGHGISPGEAILILLFGLQVSYVAPFIYDAFVQLRTQAVKRSSLLWFLSSVPQEAYPEESDEGRRTAVINAKYGPAFEIMGGTRSSIIPTRAESHSSGQPDSGHLVVKNLRVQYAADSTQKSSIALALVDVDVEVLPGTWVTVVGKPGAGKSTLVNAIARIIEPVSGVITLGGVSTSLLSLRTLRRSIGFASYSTFVLSDSLRKNVDPFDEYSDIDVLHALEVLNWPFHKPKEISETGLSALSVDEALHEGGDATRLVSHEVPGAVMLAAAIDSSRVTPAERLIIGLARALLHRSRLLVLDETDTTADPDKEAAVHATVRSVFEGCAVLHIAPRLGVSFKPDVVVVLKQGVVVETGPPEHLLRRHGGELAAMVNDISEPVRSRVMSAVFPSQRVV